MVNCGLFWYISNLNSAVNAHLKSLASWYAAMHMFLEQLVWIEGDRVGNKNPSPNIRNLCSDH